MRRLSLQLAAALALTAISIATAFAHASLETSEAVPGAYKAVMRLPHGCDGKPTDTVRIAIPEGFINAKPMPKPGWRLEIETGDYAHSYDYHGEAMSAGAKAVIWSGGSLDDAHYDEFVVNGTLDAGTVGTTLAFVTVQKCGDDEVAWDQIAAARENPHSLDHPAPTLSVAAGGHDLHAGHGGAKAAEAGDIEVGSAFARAMLPGQKVGGGYLTITNKVDTPDRLVAISSPSAGKVEIHSMELTDGVMKMRPLESGLEIPAGATIELQPGGLHVMFSDVDKPFAEGGEIPVTLEFERAGKVEVLLPVRPAGGGAHKH